MKNDPILEIDNLSLTIGGNAILRDVTFVVPEGQYLSIVGPNGAGKSSLLKCLIRIRSDWTGSVRVQGRSTPDMTQKELAARLCYVPQADGSVFPFTVRQFVLMGRYPHHSPFTFTGAEDLRIVDRSLAMTGTARFAERDIRTLSGGERQKVLIAGALAQGAGVLLLDEPTTFLDPLHAGEVQSLLLELNRDSGVTVLAVTHDINHAALYSDRVVALVNGEVAFDGLPDMFMDNAVLEGIYARPFTFVGHPVTGRPMVVPEGPGS
ncbi:MAG: ABC transporter ATP-binding protein [bacterium]|nr:ABC transporter ATP-binding protein [bacterium]MDT8396237.1 ABC transporter ATP-binding protein [bacterium]